MDAKVVWLFVFVALYWSYCIFWGIKGALSAKTASDYFVAGRQISLWVFILAATATSFSGWTFMGHPGLIYRDGFQYAYASFYAITIPFTGVLFLKRQWMLGKRFGFITPGEMLAYYFRSDLIRILVVLVALIFSVPYLGIQLRASGFLFNVLTDNMLSTNVGMWLLSTVVIIYVASGGLRAVAYVDSAQAILLGGGIVVIGLIAMHAVGGFANLNQGIAALSQIDPVTGKAMFGQTTPDGYSAYIAIPGVIQFGAGLGTDSAPIGGAWTGLMVLTYMFGLMGIQSAPAFSMWAFGNKSPEPFAPQQVWASSFVIGFILVFFTAIQGIGAHFLGADLEFMAKFPDLVNNVMGTGLGGLDIMQSEGKGDMLVPQLVYLMSETAPWLVGLLSVCALAAMQSTGSAYMSTAGGMLTRDLLKRFIIPNASHAQQKMYGRLGVILIVLAALVVASTSSDALVLLGGLAVAYGFQMWPALIAVCWWPYLTRQGITVGLIAGLIAVTLTESIGAQYMPWGRWPMTLHSAFWGILFNFSLALIISAMTQKQNEHEHRMIFHNFLRDHASLSPEKRGLIPVAWIATLTWFFFGIGPGAVIGNWVFGDPTNAETWTFGMPSIWAWQLLWWLLGVGMMWLLAYKMELSTIPHKEVVALHEDIGDIQLDIDKPG
ncbi:sodium:solute symporter family protein [Sedimenticola selenatireducens]|uniref:Sodium:solute symporter family protein n=1 Tax=Sedimenticola selenatireducens TaxID=191960 RepID=A0A557RXC8_9GAMM|nr:sodium:solute symporter family protein [Sedimenticola selenatireducens]TVO69857.1 sodium:solute symporter family protein [Sedimenticola selenatireducens]TVT63186.1 MAG: sodium:solute symporter family protein [Sedimenticola selenatireducens]